MRRWLGDKWILVLLAALVLVTLDIANTTWAFLSHPANMTDYSPFYSFLHPILGPWWALAQLPIAYAMLCGAYLLTRYLGHARWIGLVPVVVSGVIVFAHDLPALLNLPGWNP